MKVTKGIWDAVEIGDYIWQYHWSNGPKIGKSFIRGKGHNDDRFSYNKNSSDNEYTLVLSNNFSNDINDFYTSENDAMERYIKEMKNYRLTVANQLNSIDDIINDYEDSFKTMSEDYLNTSDRNSADGMMCIMDALSVEDTNFKITKDDIPPLEYNVDDIVYTAVNVNTSNIYGERDNEYKVIKDRVASIEVMFRRENDIEVFYNTTYIRKHHIHSKTIFKTKEDAIQYCEDDAKEKINFFTERKENIHFIDAQTDTTDDPTTRFFKGRYGKDDIDEIAEVDYSDIDITELL